VTNAISTRRGHVFVTPRRDDVTCALPIHRALSKRFARAEKGIFLNYFNWSAAIVSVGSVRFRSGLEVENASARTFVRPSALREATRCPVGVRMSN